MAIFELLYMLNSSATSDQWYADMCRSNPLGSKWVHDKQRHNMTSHIIRVEPLNELDAGPISALHVMSLESCFGTTINSNPKNINLLELTSFHYVAAHCMMLNLSQFMLHEADPYITSLSLEPLSLKELFPFFKGTDSLPRRGSCFPSALKK